MGGERRGGGWYTDTAAPETHAVARHPVIVDTGPVIVGVVSAGRGGNPL